MKKLRKKHPPITNQKKIIFHHNNTKSHVLKHAKNERF